MGFNLRFTTTLFLRRATIYYLHQKHCSLYCSTSYFVTTTHYSTQSETATTSVRYHHSIFEFNHFNRQFLRWLIFSVR